MSKKDMDRRKKFILELMGDPIYQPMRLREISSLLRLSKEEKRELYDVLDELCEEGKVSVDRKLSLIHILVRSVHPGRLLFPSCTCGSNDSGYRG